MRLTLAIGFLFATMSFAGCSEDTTTPATRPCTPGSKATGPVGDLPQTDFITPGTWRVCNAEDRVLVWVHNTATTERTGTWSLTMADGSALPSGWSVKFAQPTFTLKPVGTKTTTGGQRTYPDWAWTLATLNIPSGTQPGFRNVTLHAGPLTKDATIEVVTTTAALSKSGSSVNAGYAGTFSDGTPFDDGSFDTTLGRGETVPGFDFGLMGLAKLEKARLVLPPALGYGYDQTGDRARFNGRVLVFDVEILSLA